MSKETSENIQDVKGCMCFSNIYVKITMYFILHGIEMFSYVPYCGRHFTNRRLCDLKSYGEQ